MKRSKDLLILTGKPKSTNTLYRYACRGNYPTMYMTKAGKDTKERYQWEAKEQWMGQPLDEQIALDVHIYFGDKRVRDIDNFSKILLDSLTGIVWRDDRQVYKMAIEKHYDKDNSRIEVKIKRGGK